MAKVPELEVVKVFSGCPSTNELLRKIRVRKVNLLLFCVDDFLRAEFLAKSIDDLIPGIPIITAGDHNDPEILHR